MLDDIFHLLHLNPPEEAMNLQDHKSPDELLLHDSDLGSPYADLEMDMIPSSPSELAHPHVLEAHSIKEHSSEEHAHHRELLHEGHSQHPQTELGHPYVQHLEPGPHIPPTHHQAHNHSNEPFSAIWKDAIVPHEIHWDLADFHGVGHPAQYSHYWLHQSGKDCAVMAEGEILASITGQHFTEQQLSHMAQHNGWYDPHKGTMPENVGKILEEEGIAINRLEHATFRDIVHALEHEQRVIVGINANEIWHPYHDTLTNEPVKLPHVGHTVWVTGVDQEPDGSVKVILTDSAAPHGQMEAVDVRDFLNAWEDTDNFMVSTSPFPLAP